MTTTPTPPPSGDQYLVLSYLAIRRAVGILGILLPLVLPAGAFLFYHCSQLEPSISDYYHTYMRDVFVGTLCAVALFLFTYKGYDKWDRLATNLASLFALGIAFCPTGPVPGDCSCSIPCSHAENLLNILHFVFASTFFLTLAIISFFFFTKSKGTMTAEKKKRNRVYRVCALIMVVCLLMIALYLNIGSWHDRWEKYDPVYWLELIALFAFGASWLVKGEMILGDKNTGN